MKNQERSDKIKKFLITLLIIITPLNFISASENSYEYPDITEAVEIKYKWYKNVLSNEGEYYPLKDVKPQDIIDKNNIKYVQHDVYEKDYCTLPNEYYEIEQKYIRQYKKTYNAKYVIIENVSTSDQIEIYYDNQKINFNVINNENNIIKLDLNESYQCDQLMFFVDTLDKYKISLYKDSKFQKFIIEKEIKDKKINIPDKTWITDKTKFELYLTSTEQLKQGELTKLLSENIVCKYSEKYVYKYEIKKEYYDDNYYSQLDGYIKDQYDYKVFYKGKPITITNTIEVIKEKIVKEPQIEYVYIETTKNDSSKKNECSQETKTEIKTEIKTIEKEVLKVPKKIYFIISILIIIIILLLIKKCKKYVT